MLEVLLINVYVLLDPGETLSFVIFLVAMKFVFLPDILDRPFLIASPRG